jgi:hypothetical protein
MPEIVEMPSTVLASAGMLTAQYERQQLMSCDNSRKNYQNGEKFLKNYTFLVLRFHSVRQLLDYRKLNVASLIVEVR